jgi:hypothetical protein
MSFGFMSLSLTLGIRCRCGGKGRPKRRARVAVRDLAGWLQVVLGVVTLLVTVGGTGAVIHATGSQHLSPTPSPLSTPPVATMTAVAPSAATASSSPGAPPPATPPVIFDDQVSFSDINFDVNPPKAVDLTSGAPYTLDYQSGGTMVGGILSASTGASEAIWTAASPPSYAQCRQWVTTNAGSGQDVIQNGMQLCVESAADRIIYLKIINADTMGGVVTAEAKVWRRRS